MTIIGLVLLIVGLIIADAVHQRTGSALAGLIAGFVVLGVFMVLFGVTDSRTGAVIIAPIAK